ncbi:MULTISPECIES: hypothetical protein [unclassified Roseateles]|uniref:hypothetical protein n=1 Tax=unclassified Roseateles TaxID=2626991 RepID=UPI0006FE5794|nr:MULTISPECIES: hypothetical protein [unclassified Roseateles]KQW45842.1 hypothetical protein ASC81_13245 [Pelomonas sp. Root405]KRA72687.1 hypothetical protein ASD88_13245 [Pelomonas sp. Root662]
MAMAPAADGHGSSYSFAERRHGRGLLSIAYRVDKFEQTGEGESHLGWLDAQMPHRAQWAFIADLGAFPIEKLAQRNWPDGCSGPTPWDDRLSNSDLSRINAYPRQELVSCGDWELAARQRLHFGHAYLLRARLRSGVEGMVAMQAFGTQITGQVLLAWIALEVHSDVDQRALSVPARWWRLGGWLELYSLLRATVSKKLRQPTSVR